MMKRVLVVAVLFMPAVSHAWEHPLNPDRFPSIGFSLSGQSVSGDASYPSLPGLGKQNQEENVGMFILDTRLPLSNSFTLDFALGSVSSEVKADATSTLSSAKFDGSGGYFKIGGRYYFNSGSK